MNKRLFSVLFVTALAFNAEAQIIYIDDSGKDGKQNTTETHYLHKKDVTFALRPITPDSIRLLGGLFKERYELNRNYMMSLEPVKLLQNFYAEAGLNKEFMV